MDFVVRFNRHGVDSAIASTFDINGAVAGTYLACFQQAISSGEKSIAAAHFQAVNRCTWQDVQAPDVSKKPLTKLLSETYAANALKYVLVGNSVTAVCP
jgi:hypothetical protein